MAELVHCNSCGGSFRYDPPPRRERRSGAMCAEPMDGPLRCRRCWRAVTDPPLSPLAETFRAAVLRRLDGP